MRPERTPIGEYVDASWAAVVDLIGPVENRHEVMAQLWADITGEDPATGGGRPVDEAERRGDQATVDTVRALDDEQRARWVPAYRKALDLAESDPEQADKLLTDLDRHWEHTASFAGGQQSLVSQFGDAAVKAGPKRSGQAPVGPSPAPAGATPAAAGFGMPPGMEG